MKLKYIMFTKHLEGLDVTGIIKALQSVGVKGFLGTIFSFHSV